MNIILYILNEFFNVLSPSKEIWQVVKQTINVYRHKTSRTWKGKEKEYHIAYRDITIIL